MSEIIEIEKVEMELNYDTSTYEFLDLDLELATKRLPSKDQEVLILHLMGHTHSDIAKFQNVNRSTISKKLKKIVNDLSRLMR